MGVLESFCEREQFNKQGVILRIPDDTMLSIDSDLLPEGYEYKVPEGYIVVGIND